MNATLIQACDNCGKPRTDPDDMLCQTCTIKAQMAKHKADYEALTPEELAEQLAIVDEVLAELIAEEQAER